MPPKKGSKKTASKSQYTRPEVVPDLDELTRHSDDEMALEERDAEDEFAEQVEIGKLADSDDDEIPTGPSRWDKIREQEFAEIDRKAKSWGKNKEAYYEADTQYLDVDYNEDAATLEEQQVIQLQKEQGAALRNEDFGLDELISRKKTKKVIASAQDTLNTLDTLRKLDLTKDEKIKQIIQDSPELLSMLDEYTAKMKEVRTEIHPLLQRVKSQDEELLTEDGISFLQLRYQLLISYCIHIVFYLLLKAEGKNVQSHPVIKRLVQIRIVLEKMKPVMTQLSYQIEKLLASIQPTKSTSNADKEAEILAYKPNVDSFGKLPGEVDDMDDDSSNKISSKFSGKKSKYNSKTKGLETTDIEHAERLANQMRDKADDKVLSYSERQFAKSLRDELLEKPETLSTIGTSTHRIRSVEADRAEFEEEHYVRLMDTKESKKKRKMAERMQGFDDVDDFDNISKLIHFEKKQRKLEAERQHLQALRTNIDEASYYDDNDGSNMDMLADEYDEGDIDTYNQAVQESRQKSNLKKKLQKLSSTRKVYDEETDPNMVDADERRGAGLKILQNKGLMRAPRKHTHARTAYRAKHEKAMVKHRKLVKEYSGKKDTDYTGESTGIKSNVIRARILKK